MALTPVEIRHLTPPRGFRGYKRAPTDKLLAEIVTSFEDVWRERADLSDKVEQLESDLVRYRELEALLRTTLVSAERASHELKDQAKREAETIVAEAQAEARTITRQARTEHELLAVETRRMRLLLHAALDALDEADVETDEEVVEEEAARGAQTKAA